LKDSHTLKELDSLNVPYSQSQLLLLRSQRLIERNQNRYKTIIPILDNVQTAALRKQSQHLSNVIFPSIEKESKELVDYLKKNNQSDNAFSILFSYVLDDLIWKRFEKEELVAEWDGTGIWSGNYWFLTPKRSFACGTNSITEGDKYVFSVNWSERVGELMNNFYSLNFTDLLKSLEQGNRITNRQIIDEFSAFGFFDKNENLTIPIIDENADNKLFLLSNKIIDKLFPAFIKEANIETVKTSYKFKDNSETIVVFYHEVMWDILNLLLDSQIIQMPLAFKSPKEATARNIADLCFITIKNN
jgi:hypothetical protein